MLKWITFMMNILLNEYKFTLIYNFLRIILYLDQLLFLLSLCIYFYLKSKILGFRWLMSLIDHFLLVALLREFKDNMKPPF